MTIRSATLLVTLAASLTIACGQETTAPTSGGPATTNPASLKTESERISYALGLKIGRDLKGLTLSAAALDAGFRDAAAGARPQLTDDEMTTALMAVQQKANEAAEARVSAEADANLKAGEAYLAQNAKKEGVKTTASGLQYKVIKSGSGKSPKATDTVSVNYRGTLINGTEFDASRGNPVTFQVNGVIPGWTEALQLMKEGGKNKFIIPYQLGYGEQGYPGVIPPKSWLIFDIELIKVNN